MPREQYQIRWKDYYQILGLDPAASSATIKNAFRKLARDYHPDRNHQPGATAAFQEIIEARDVLTDPDRRADYDEEYRARMGGAADEAPGGEYSAAGDSQDYRWYEDPQDRRSDADQDWYSSWNSAGGSNYTYGGGYRWNGNRDSRRNDTWDSEEPPDSGHYEPATEEVREKIYSSRFFLFAIIAYLVDRIAPDPDESQRILPWPSWSWQRTVLLTGMPVAFLLFLFSMAQGNWLLGTGWALWFAASLYGGTATCWLRRSRQAQVWVRIATGGCIILSGVSCVLAVAYVALLVAVLVAAFLAMGVILRAMLDQTLDRR